jgi:hypothetical protein
LKDRKGITDSFGLSHADPRGFGTGCMICAMIDKPIAARRDKRISREGLLHQFFLTSQIGRT